MIKKRIIAIFILLMIMFQIIMPIIPKSYATEDELDLVNITDEVENTDTEDIENETEEILEDSEQETEKNINDENSKIEENLDDIDNSNELDNEDSNENIEDEKNEEKDTIIDLENIEEELKQETNEEDDDTIPKDKKGLELVMEEMNVDTPVIVGAASGSGANAGSEAEFSNLFYNTGVGELTIQTSIRLTSSYTVNHSMRIDSSSQQGSNALQLSSGCNIVVPNGCVLTLDGVVVDGRSFSNNDGKSCITVQNGGVLMLTEHSIIDGGTGNWGINVESGGQLLVESGQVCYCDRGIVLQGGSYCDLASGTAVEWWGNTGKPVDILSNNIGIYCGGAYCGTLIVNHTSQSNEKINFDYNTYGIFSEAHSGSITVAHARMANNGWAIYTFGNMTINDVNGAFNSRGIVNDGGTVFFKGGSFYSDTSNLKEYGIYNASGTIHMQGGSVYNNNVGVFNAGTVNMSNGTVGANTTGIENNGTFNLSGGLISIGTYGINNSTGNVNMSGGTISNFNWGVKNPATFNISGGNITGNSVYGLVNEASSTVTGQVYMTGGNITGNTNYDIYHGKSDTDGAGAVYGGLRIERNDTVSSKIILAAYNNYIYTGSHLPTLNNVTLGDVHLERHVIRGVDNSSTANMVSKVTVNNKGSYYLKANGSGNSGYVALWTNYTVTTIHKTKSNQTLSSSSKTYAYKDNYTTSAGNFDGYVLTNTPTNANGTVTGNVTVTYIYDQEANVAVVNYKELLSGVVSAKYWYNANNNSFSGNGTDFNDGTVFENYGYYKVVVTNGVGLSKTLTFELNQNSV